MLRPASAAALLAAAACSGAANRPPPLAAQPGDLVIADVTVGPPINFVYRRRP
jgi:hypothetical protein